MLVQLNGGFRMKEIKIGTSLFKDRRASGIYEKFSEYFTIEKEGEYIEMLVISKEPSTELINAIMEYWLEIKEEENRRKTFIDDVALEVLGDLTEKDRAYIHSHPDPTTHHFGMGLAIRNKYIHGKELGFPCFGADSLSSEIILRIASHIIEEFEYDNLLHQNLYGMSSFNYLRAIYTLITGKEPVELLKKYSLLPDSIAAADEVMKIMEGFILEKNRTQERIKKYKIPEKQYLDFVTFLDSYNEKERRIIPCDILLLSSDALESQHRKQILGILEVILKENVWLTMELPACIFNQKDAVLMAVKIKGDSLRRFTKYNADEEVIINALSANGKAIQYVKKELRDRKEYLKLALSDRFAETLEMNCMKKYRDDEEMMKIALEANGSNIEYASDRLKDCDELAKIAITHQRNYRPDSTICNLSERLRDTLEIALLDIEEGHACIDSYSDRLRDSEEVAEVLIKSQFKWKMYLMSERIQKIYGEE